tara:strand:+ start:93 stop:323 length:231 start_codon:yes stop_codon:yes gene_type:complete
MKMTMVDPVTKWSELVQLFDTPTAFYYQLILDAIWLAKYPDDEKFSLTMHENSKDYFPNLCRNMGLTEKKSLPWNP